MEEETLLENITRTSFYAIEIFTCSLITATIILTFIFIKFHIYGESMLPILHDKDRLLVCHFFYEPQRGDIVAIKNPGYLNKTIIKRIIAKEGDTIKIDRNAGKVCVNGETLNEPYIYEPGKPFKHYANEWNMPELIPKNCYVVLGDNRNNSTDSRSMMVKFVNKKEILGKALMIFYPLNRFKIL